MYGDKLPIAQSRWLVNRTEALARLANLLAIRVRGVTLPKRHWIDYESRERSAKKETFYKSWQEKMTITTLTTIKQSLLLCKHCEQTANQVSSVHT